MSSSLVVAGNFNPPLNIADNMACTAPSMSHLAFSDQALPYSLSALSSCNLSLTAPSRRLHEGPERAD